MVSAEHETEPKRGRKKTKKRTEDFLARFGNDARVQQTVMSTNYWRREETTGDSQENTQSAAEHAIVRGRKGGRRHREREKDEGQILTMVKYCFHPFVTVVTA